jgi:hypothetical protein
LLHCRAYAHKDSGTDGIPDPMGWIPPASVSVSDETLGSYKFSQTTHPQFSDSPPPPQTLWETGHLMSYTPMRRDTVDNCCGGYTPPHSEAAPQTYSPEHEHEHADAPPPPHRVPAVSILRCIASVSSIPILFSRPRFPRVVPAMPLNGMRVMAAWACRCHMSPIWLAAIAF